MFLVSILYLFLTVVFTWPLILNLSTHTPGTIGDSYQFIWFAWWFKHALLELHQNPTFVNYIFYPAGSSLGGFDFSWFSVIIAIPLQAIFNAVTSYNIIFFMTFVVSGLSAYLLCYYFTKDKLASFLGGFIFAFGPQRMGFGLGFMQLLNVQFLPLYILYLFRFKEDKSPRNFMLAVFFLWLTSICSWYYFALSFIFTIFFTAYYLCTKRVQRKAFFKKMVLLLGVSFLAILPFFYPAIQAGLSGAGRPDGLQQADLASFFIPFAYHPLFGHFSTRFFDNIKGCPADSTLFIGYTVIFFLAYSFFKIHNNSARFWKTSLIFFFFLSLGPYLIILGREYLNFPLVFFFLADSSLYLYFHRLTFFGVLISLSSAIIFSMSFKNLRLPRYAVCIVILLIFLEFFSAPYPITSQEVPPFYKAIGKDKGKYAIAEIPLYECPSAEPKCQYYYCFYQYWQTFHHKPILGGYLARNIPKKMVEFTENTDFIRQLKNPGQISALDKNTVINVLKNNNIKYVILHEYFLFKDNRGKELLFTDKDNFEAQKKLCDTFLKQKFNSYGMFVYEVD